MIDVAVVRGVAAAIQWIVLFCSLATLALCVVMGYNWKRTRPYLILPVTLALHSILFYAFALSDALSSPWGNLWSAVLRLHSYLVILGVMAVVFLSLYGRDDEGDE